MTDIPNTEYITINKDGIFVGGKPATRYRGQEIYDIDSVKKAFAGLLKENPNIKEWHVMSSKTHGKYAAVGNPSFEHGVFVWMRVVLSDGTVGGWVFAYTGTSAPNCAYYCADYCANSVRADAAFRRAVSSAAFDKQDVKPVTQPEKKSQNPEIEKLKKIDFSKLPKSPIELNGYRILVEKIAKRTK